MSRNHPLKIALIGNPNSGKSTIFNLLTGLNQRTGNFAGVTVEKKSGICKLNNGSEVEIIDLPGTYSIYPKSYDERIVFDILINPKNEDYPTLCVVVVDSSNLNRNLLLFTQLYDMGLPVVLVLNMIDVSERRGIEINASKLSRFFQGVPVIKMNSRKGIGLDELKGYIKDPSSVIETKKLPIFNTEAHANITTFIKEKFEISSSYASLLVAHNYKQIIHLNNENKTTIEDFLLTNQFDSIKAQTNETITRYQKIKEIIDISVTTALNNNKQKIVAILDRFLTHKIGGYAFLFVLFLLIFQSIFTWAEYPMNLIDGGIGWLNTTMKGYLPESIWVDLLTDGLIAGLGGVLVFIPQIAILFAFIAVLEETGYMARVMFLMDNIMKPFGLNGKSIVPLFSGAACAIPAIMAARNIGNKKEQLITIFVTPLISCSARIPVYTIIIALIIPTTQVFGFINLQGIAMMSMYILGFLMALLSALLLKFIVKTEERSFFILEMPDYKLPKVKNVLLTVVDKVKSFVVGAGKVIITISVVLWFLSTFGPREAMKEAEMKIIRKYESGESKSLTSLENEIAASKLEASYAGHFGKFIEPVIRPLGFDWKIGVALLTSFAAREVFVGTISTIYSIGSDVEENTIREKLALQKDPVTLKPYFNFARGISLLVFYAFALQCMSTIATVKRETGKWKIALLQFLYLSVLAYLASFAAYSLLK